jgi:glutathione S-transferase
MLKIWGRRSSFNVQKVMWLVGELGLAHRCRRSGRRARRAGFPGDEPARPRSRHRGWRRRGVGIPHHSQVSSLYRYFELEIDRPPLPQVERWYRTLQGRAAYTTHVMIPFGELRGRLD